MSLANDQVLACLAAMEGTLQSKANLSRPSVDDGNTLWGAVNGLLETKFAVLPSLALIKGAFAFWREKETVK